MFGNNSLILTIVACVVLLIPLVVVVLVVMVRFVRRYVTKLVPLSDRDGAIAGSGATAAEQGEQAKALGFSFFGAFRDEESSIVKARVDLLLNEDGRVLLMLPARAMTLGYRFVTRMADDVWLVTAETATDEDLSGFRRSKILPGCEMDMVLRYHMDRVGAYDEPAVPFDPESIVHDLYDHHLMRARRTIELGKAKWISEERRCYTVTWTQAVRSVFGLLKTGSLLSEGNAMAERYKASMGSGPEVVSPDEGSG